MLPIFCSREEQIDQLNRIRAFQLVRTFANIRPQDSNKMQSFDDCRKIVKCLLDSSVDETIDSSILSQLRYEFERIRMVEHSDVLQTPAKLDPISTESSQNLIMKIEDQASARLASLSLNQTKPRQEKRVLGLFIMCLLDKEFSSTLSPYFRWSDASKGIFVLEEKTGTAAMAQLWGLAKKNPRMNYENLSRDLRAYRANNKMIACKARLNHQFNYDHKEVKIWLDKLASPETRPCLIESTKLIVDEWFEMKRNSSAECDQLVSDL